MHNGKQPKKFSEKFERLKVIIRRDCLIIIVAVVLAISLHMYVKYEKAQNKSTVEQELKLRD